MSTARAITTDLIEEMRAVLFRIVRQNVLGQAIGHDTMVQARSVVRRVNPDAYRDLLRRRQTAGLPDRADDGRAPKEYVAFGPGYFGDYDTPEEAQAVVDRNGSGAVYVKTETK